MTPVERARHPAAFPARHVLVLGGARSGKSRYAQTLAEAAGERRRLVFCATAGPAWDGEMAERIARHQADRDARWRTLEAPLDLPGALRAEAGPGAVVLVDCLTLWLTNLLMAERDLDAEAAALADGVAGLEGAVVFVSNEVGGGIVPDNAMARRFRDAQGRLNQRMAAACEAVVLVTAGLPLRLKPAPDPGVTLGG